MSGGPKFCRDCVFYTTNERWGLFARRPPADRFAKCAHPAAFRKGQEDYLVTGDATDLNSKHCSVMRMFDCGPDAKLFEANR